MQNFRLRLWCAWHVLRGRPLMYGMTFRLALNGEADAVRLGETAGALIARCIVLPSDAPYDMSHLKRAEPAS